MVLLKGATSVISDGTQLYYNTTGNPGLSKGGSGDMLSGIGLALLCQGLKPIYAAAAASYLLGASADEAVRLLGERLLLARDVWGCIPAAILGEEAPTP